MPKIILSLLIALAACRPLCASPTDPAEVCRIRIQNKAGGLVQVSADGGNRWSAVGRVTVAANARIVGFAAASYIPGGTVAATAVHGLRIKTGQFAYAVGKAQMPLMFSIIPLEFAQIPKGYGGHIPRSAGVHTDIYSGHSIFRNLSPYVGNPVMIERNHALEPLPEDYIPEGRETFVIVVKSRSAANEIEFENRAGGSVIARYPGGNCEVIARVVRPVTGVGRYDGTSFTGVGAVNTNHGGVLTISTAPIQPPGFHEGGSVETRGGFMIQPSYHVREQGENKVQVMVIAAKDSSKPTLEGTPPIFDGCINLAYDPRRPRNSYRAQIKIDGGEWEEMPEIVGKVDNAFTGVTAIRLLFPEFDPRFIADDLAREAADYTARARKSGVKPEKGIISLAPVKPRRDARMVTFYIDGNPVHSSNAYPYRFEWDSSTVSNGLHKIEIETILDSSSQPVVEERIVLIDKPLTSNIQPLNSKPHLGLHQPENCLAPHRAL